MPDDDARWLTDEELGAWISLSQVVIRLPGLMDAQLKTDSGLTFFEYMVLAVTSQQPERTVRMSELASLAGGSLSRLSHVASRLEGRGWLTRRPDPDDGRYTQALLTDEGHAALAEAAPGHVDRVRSVVFDGLSAAQVRALGSTLGRLVDRIDELDPDAPRLARRR